MAAPPSLVPRPAVTATSLLTSALQAPLRVTPGTLHIQLLASLGAETLLLHPANRGRLQAEMTRHESGRASAEEAARHPLGAALWAIDGVAGVFAVRDFVTVTRTPEASWESLSPRVAAAIVEVLGAR
jgi:hypothetical protein